jgi:hypothetical protein
LLFINNNIGFRYSTNAEARFIDIVDVGGCGVVLADHIAIDVKSSFKIV